MLKELYYNNAEKEDIPIKGIYGAEVCGSSRLITMLECPLKLFIAFLERIIPKHFLCDFNIESIYFLCGAPMFNYGLVLGLINYFNNTSIHEYAPTGTIIIPTLFILLGIQFLLPAISYDISNYPKRFNN